MCTKTIWWFIVSLILYASGIVVKGECPSSDGPMVRLDDSRYYIFQKPQTRSYHQNFDDAKKLCESNSLRMATIRNISTFHYVGRILETWVKETKAQDTWYWLDAKFDPKKEVYEWGNNPNDPLKFTNFFYRYPRPTGVGSQVDWHHKYLKNSTVEQCLSLALPLPGPNNHKKGSVIFGHSTTFDEKPCEGAQKRHPICESMLPECNSKIQDPFYLSEDKGDYFDNGHWIVGDRKYIVIWKQMSQPESKKYCEDLGLQLFNPAENEHTLLPHLKLWSRNVTIAQFWTDWVYEIEGTGVFKDGNGVTKEPFQKSFINITADSTQLITKRSNKNSQTFCVSVQVTYEFKEQLTCPPGANKECIWAFMQIVPSNCNNYIGTICQHKDHESRKSRWQADWITSPENFLNDGNEATVEFGWEGNTVIRRSRYKQTFGSLVCPPEYKMLRKNVRDWFSPPNNAVIYPYDFLDTYWLVDEDNFKKNATSMCAVSVPYDIEKSGIKGYGSGFRRVEMVRCTDWHFYLCRSITYPLKTPDETLPYNIPKPSGWNAERHARIYPIV